MIGQGSICFLEGYRKATTSLVSVFSHLLPNSFETYHWFPRYTVPPSSAINEKHPQFVFDHALSARRLPENPRFLRLSGYFYFSKELGESPLQEILILLPSSWTTNPRQVLWYVYDFSNLFSGSGL